jgi:hypothetical protein
VHILVRWGCVHGSTRPATRWPERQQQGKPRGSRGTEGQRPRAPRAYGLAVWVFCTPKPIGSLRRGPKHRPPRRLLQLYLPPSLSCSPLEQDPLCEFITLNSTLPAGSHSLRPSPARRMPGACTWQAWNQPAPQPVPVPVPVLGLAGAACHSACAPAGCPPSCQRSRRRWAGTPCLQGGVHARWSSRRVEGFTSSLAAFASDSWGPHDADHEFS